jgi:hypothetical protein
MDETDLITATERVKQVAGAGQLGKKPRPNLFSGGFPSATASAPWSVSRTVAGGAGAACKLQAIRERKSGKNRRRAEPFSNFKQTLGPALSLASSEASRLDLRAMLSSESEPE